PGPPRPPRRNSRPVAGSNTPAPTVRGLWTTARSGGPGTGRWGSGAPGFPGAGVMGSWPQAISWPAGAQGWSVARRAWTVSQDSTSVGGRGGRGTVACSPGATDATASEPPATSTPSASRVQEKARCDRSREAWGVAMRRPPAGSAVMRTGSTTFLSSSRPGDGVRSGNSSPSATKLPSWRGSPRWPPAAEGRRARAVLGAVGGVGAQAVVDPLPDEAALAAGVALEQLLVLPEAAGAVTHGVGVLAQDQRHGPAAGIQRRVVQRRLLAAADRVDLGVGRVHAAVDVD